MRFFTFLLLYLFTLLPLKLFIAKLLDMLLGRNTEFLQALYPSHHVTSAIVELLFSLIKRA